jgi:hypothetical protein
MRITKRQLRRIIKEAMGTITPEVWADQNGLQVAISHSGEKIIYLDNEQADTLDMPPGVNWDAQQNYDRETWTIYTGETE